MPPSPDLRLTFGPLSYQFRAHDAWGRKILDLLRDHLDCRDFSGEPLRLIHVLECPLTFEESMQLRDFTLPERLAAVAGPAAPRSGWLRAGDDCGFICWLHPAIRESFWTFGSETPHFQARYQLPWLMMIRDLRESGGALIHGGLAVRGGKGYLFIAPPQGGKSTTISKLPSPPWRVFGDDTAILWSENGPYYAVPLPTWSVLTGGNPSCLPADAPKWNVGKKVKIAGIYIIRKERPLGLRPLGRLESIQSLYAAFSEHAMIPKAGTDLRAYLGISAIKAASFLPLTELSLNLDDRFWERLDLQ